MLTSDRHSHLRRQLWIKMIVFLGILIIGFSALIFINNLLLSLVVAIIISYLISPVISYIEGVGISRIIAILLVYCFFTTLSGVAIALAAPFLLSQLATLKGQLPQYVDGTVLIFTRFAQTITDGTGGLFNIDFGEQVRSMLTRQSSILIDILPKALSSSASVLFLSPLLGFFILKDGRQFARALLKIVPNNIFELVLSLQHQINEQIAQYLRARLLESAIVGAVCWAGFLLINLPFAFLLAVFAAIANLIPYVGPIFGAAPGLILVLVNNGSTMELMLVFSVYAVAQLVDNLFVIPFVLARVVNLHPVTVILVVLVGAQLMGILGMFISIPVASAIKVTFRNVYIHLTHNSS